MNKPYTAREVRELAVTMGAMNPPTTRDMLRAYADRLEEDESSDPIYQLMATEDSWWDVSRELYEAEGSHAGRTRILYTHPALADAERLAEALRAMVALIKAHDIESLSCDRDGEKYCDCLSGKADDAIKILAAYSTQAQPSVVSVPNERKPDDGAGDEDSYNSGWNDCRKAMLAAQENPNG